VSIDEIILGIIGSENNWRIFTKKRFLEITKAKLWQCDAAIF